MQRPPSCQRLARPLLGRDRGYAEVRGIGRGSFGVTTLVRDGGGELRVMKTVDIRGLSQEEKEGAVNEARVLASLKHPYVVRYRESFLEGGALAIVMDYAEGGDLQDRITQNRFSRRSIPEAQIMEWFTQAVLALRYVHDQKIIHRDLKSGNLFLTKQGQVRLGDFGISKVAESSAVVDQNTLGTPYYLSPEICARRLFGFASDMWALGVILFELGALRVPFEAPNLTLLLQKISRLNAPTLPPCYSAGMRDLCKDLLCHEPDSRPTAAEVIRRPVVQGVISRLHQAVRAGAPAGVPDPPGSPRAGRPAEHPGRPAAEAWDGGAAHVGARATGGACLAAPRPASRGEPGAGTEGAPPRPASRGEPAAGPGTPTSRPPSRGGLLHRTGAAALLRGARVAPAPAEAAWLPREAPGGTPGDGACARSASAARAGPRGLAPGRRDAWAADSRPEPACGASAGWARLPGHRPPSPFLRHGRCRRIGSVGLQARAGLGVVGRHEAHP